MIIDDQNLHLRQHRIWAIRIHQKHTRPRTAPCAVAATPHRLLDATFVPILLKDLRQAIRPAAFLPNRNCCRGHTMQTLLTTLITWISITFGLPASQDHPRVEFVPAVKMMQIHYSRLASEPSGAAPVAEGRGWPRRAHQIHALYDDVSRTIYLPASWDAADPTDVSVLVHELVHHLQNVAGLEYHCPQERERLAYEAQGRWLEKFDTSLSEAFSFDSMTLLVRTRCMH